jgi:rubrerythrin
MLPLIQRCCWCHDALVFTERGWVHQGGGAYVMRCPDCGWYGAPHPSPARCPQCGSRELRDDHCATPYRG